jgi:mRNA interferase MazF
MLGYNYTTKLRKNQDMDKKMEEKEQNIVKRVCDDYSYTPDELSLMIGISTAELLKCNQINSIPLHIQKSIELLINANEYEKELIAWHQIKREIHTSINNPIFEQRDIYYMNLGQNIGYEQNGKGDKYVRPVLVLKKLSRYMFVGLPLTSKEKSGSFYTEITFDKKGKITKSNVVLAQIRLFSSKRLLNKIAKLEIVQFEEVKKKLSELLDITSSKKC